MKAEWAANGKAKIAKGLEKRVAKGKMEQAAADAILNKITSGTNEIVADCDLVVEAALEKMELKKEIFKSLEGICKKDCIFATNTSSLSITEISNGLDLSLIHISMKLMNEYTAPQDGEIVDVCIHDGELVEYGQCLFKIY